LCEPERAQLVQILDLFAEDDRLNVYAGKLEVRPPRAPTTGPDTEERGVGKPLATRLGEESDEL
jgi:hypothetical protein